MESVINNESVIMVEETQDEFEKRINSGQKFILLLRLSTILESAFKGTNAIIKQESISHGSFSLTITEIPNYQNSYIRLSIDEREILINFDLERNNENKFSFIASDKNGITKFYENYDCLEINEFEKTSCNFNQSKSYYFKNNMIDYFIEELVKMQKPSKDSIEVQSLVFYMIERDISDLFNFIAKAKENAIRRYEIACYNAKRKKDKQVEESETTTK